MESPLSLLVSLVIVVIFVPFLSSAKPDDRSIGIGLSSSTAYFPKLQAEKLIAQLNLFPGDDINVAAHELRYSGDSAKKIVEKRFELPVAGNAGPSLKELGHHAGYYKLPHSQAARYNFFFHDMVL